MGPFVSGRYFALQKLRLLEFYKIIKNNFLSFVFFKAMKKEFYHNNYKMNYCFCLWFSSNRTCCKISVSEKQRYFFPKKMGIKATPFAVSQQVSVNTQFIVRLAKQPFLSFSPKRIGKERKASLLAWKGEIFSSKRTKEAHDYYNVIGEKKGTCRDSHKNRSMLASSLREEPKYSLFLNERLLKPTLRGIKQLTLAVPPKVKSQTMSNDSPKNGKNGLPWRFSENFPPKKDREAYPFGKAIFFNQCFDKGRLKNFVLWFLLNYGENKTVSLVEQLKNIGFQYASKAGISLGIDDLKIPPKKADLIYEAEKQIAETVNQYVRGEITGVERFQRLIDTWHRTSEVLKQEVINYFETTDILNPVYMMAFSGARGNISQVRQLVGMRGLMADPQGQIIDFPIRSNFREGLTLTEYLISSYGARKGIVDTALRTANAGYLTRRLVDVAQHVIISKFDCGTRRGIFLTNMKEGNKTIHSLAQRTVGRILARDLFLEKKTGIFGQSTPSDKVKSQPLRWGPEALSELSKTPRSGIPSLWKAVRKKSGEGRPSQMPFLRPGEGSSVFALSKNKRQSQVIAPLPSQKGAGPASLYLPQGMLRPGKDFPAGKRNEEITLDLSFEIGKSPKMQTSGKIFVRSPLTCETSKLICQLCYGWSLGQGNLVSIGEAVGVVAAQSIGEPGTQLTMRTFHTGGVFSGDISDQIKAPFDGILEYLSAIPGTLIRTPEGQIAFLTKSEGSFIIKQEIESSLGLLEISQKKTLADSHKEEKRKYKIPTYTLLYVRNGQNVFEKQVVAQISSISRKSHATDDAQLTIYSEMEGQFYSKSLGFIASHDQFLSPRIPSSTKELFSESFEARKRSGDAIASLSETSQTLGIKGREAKPPLDKFHKFRMDSSLNENELEVEKIYEAWMWGYAWILSGKVFNFKYASPFFVQLGDFLNKKSYINQITWKLNLNNGNHMHYESVRQDSNWSSLSSPLIAKSVGKKINGAASWASSFFRGKKTGLPQEFLTFSSKKRQLSIDSGFEKFSDFLFQENKTSVWNLTKKNKPSHLIAPFSAERSEKLSSGRGSLTGTALPVLKYSLPYDLSRFLGTEKAIISKQIPKKTNTLKKLRFNQSSNVFFFDLNKIIYKKSAYGLELTNKIGFLSYLQKKTIASQNNMLLGQSNQSKGWPSISSFLREKETPEQHPSSGFKSEAFSSSGNYPQGPLLLQRQKASDFIILLNSLSGPLVHKKDRQGAPSSFRLPEGLKVSSPLSLKMVGGHKKSNFLKGTSQRLEHKWTDFLQWFPSQYQTLTGGIAFFEKKFIYDIPRRRVAYSISFPNKDSLMADFPTELAQLEDPAIKGGCFDSVPVKDKLNVFLDNFQKKLNSKTHMESQRILWLQSNFWKICGLPRNVGQITSFKGLPRVLFPKRIGSAIEKPSFAKPLADKERPAVSLQQPLTMLSVNSKSHSFLGNFQQKGFAPADSLLKSESALPLREEEREAYFARREEQSLPFCSKRGPNFKTGGSLLVFAFLNKNESLCSFPREASSFFPFPSYEQGGAMILIKKLNQMNRQGQVKNFALARRTVNDIPASFSPEGNRKRTKQQSLNTMGDGTFIKMKVSLAEMLPQSVGQISKESKLGQQEISNLSISFGEDKLFFWRTQPLLPSERDTSSEGIPLVADFQQGEREGHESTTALFESEKTTGVRTNPYVRIVSDKLSTIDFPLFGPFIIDLCLYLCKSRNQGKGQNFAYLKDVQPKSPLLEPKTSRLKITTYCKLKETSFSLSLSKGTAASSLSMRRGRFFPLYEQELLLPSLRTGVAFSRSEADRFFIAKSANFIEKFFNKLNLVKNLKTFEEFMNSRCLRFGVFGEIGFVDWRSDSESFPISGSQRGKGGLGVTTIPISLWVQAKQKVQETGANISGSDFSSISFYKPKTAHTRIEPLLPFLNKAKTSYCPLEEAGSKIANRSKPIGSFILDNFHNSYGLSKKGWVIVPFTSFQNLTFDPKEQKVGASVCSGSKNFSELDKKLIYPGQKGPSLLSKTTPCFVPTGQGRQSSIPISEQDEYHELNILNQISFHTPIFTECILLTDIFHIEGMKQITSLFQAYSDLSSLYVNEAEFTAQSKLKWVKNQKNRYPLGKTYSPSQKAVLGPFALQKSIKKVDEAASLGENRIASNLSPHSEQGAATLGSFDRPTVNFIIGLLIQPIEEYTPHTNNRFKKYVYEYTKNVLKIFKKSFPFSSLRAGSRLPLGSARRKGLSSLDFVQKRSFRFERKLWKLSKLSKLSTSNFENYGNCPQISKKHRSMVRVQSGLSVYKNQSYMASRKASPVPVGVLSETHYPGMTNIPISKTPLFSILVNHSFDSLLNWKLFRNPLYNKQENIFLCKYMQQDFDVFSLNLALSACAAFSSIISLNRLSHGQGASLILSDRSNESFEAPTVLNALEYIVSRKALNLSSFLISWKTNWGKSLAFKNMSYRMASVPISKLDTSLYASFSKKMALILSFYLYKSSQKLDFSASSALTLQGFRPEQREMPIIMENPKGLQNKPKSSAFPPLKKAGQRMDLHSLLDFKSTVYYHINSLINRIMESPCFSFNLIYPLNMVGLFHNNYIGKVFFPFGPDIWDKRDKNKSNTWKKEARPLFSSVTKPEQITKIGFFTSNSASLLNKASFKKVGKLSQKTQYLYSFTNNFKSTRYFAETNYYSPFVGEIIYLSNQRNMGFKASGDLFLKEHLVRGFEEQQKEVLPITTFGYNCMFLTQVDLVSYYFRKEESLVMSSKGKSESTPFIPILSPSVPSTKSVLEKGSLAKHNYEISNTWTTSVNFLKITKNEFVLELFQQSNPSVFRAIKSKLQDQRVAVSKNLSQIPKSEISQKEGEFYNTNFDKFIMDKKTNFIEQSSTKLDTSTLTMQSKQPMLELSRKEIRLNLKISKLKAGIPSIFCGFSLLAKKPSILTRGTLSPVLPVLKPFIIKEGKTSFQKLGVSETIIHKGKVSSLLGDFIVYGDQISFTDLREKSHTLPLRAVKKSGQIIHYNRDKITLRRGQAIFISPKGILHKFDGDFIDAKTPVITLSYERLKTGDIIQGIPKVEQFFEARTTKRGRIFRDSLPALLKGLFNRYKSKYPLELAVRQSFYKIQQIIVDGVQRVYKAQGVTIADKHLEVIVKQMTSKVRIIDGAQTGFFPGEVVDLFFVEKVNGFLIKKITYEPLVLGITKASLEVDSFLSASSFQQTTRILSQAAIYRKKDFLKGLKENVILGNLIPAGTGYLVYLNDVSPLNEASFPSQ